MLKNPILFKQNKQYHDIRGFFQEIFLKKKKLKLILYFLQSHVQKKK